MSIYNDNIYINDKKKEEPLNEGVLDVIFAALAGAYFLFIGLCILFVVRSAKKQQKRREDMKQFMKDNPKFVELLIKYYNSVQDVLFKEFKKKKVDEFIIRKEITKDDINPYSKLSGQNPESLNAALFKVDIHKIVAKYYKYNEVSSNSIPREVMNILFDIRDSVTLVKNTLAKRLGASTYLWSGLFDSEYSTESIFAAIANYPGEYDYYSDIYCVSEFNKLEDLDIPEEDKIKAIKMHNIKI